MCAISLHPEVLALRPRPVARRSRFGWGGVMLFLVANLKEMGSAMIEERSLEWRKGLERQSGVRQGQALVRQDSGVALDRAEIQSRNL